MKPTEKRIKEFNKDLLPNSRRLKYERMAENEFRFFRGTCHLFYEDVSKENDLPPSPIAWISGDLHIENFGSYKSNNRLVYFDMNDFGEAILAPAFWEILRMVSSIFVAFDSEPLKISEKKANKMAGLFLNTYTATLRKGKAIYIEPQIAKGVVRTFLEHISARRQNELINERCIEKNNKLRLLIEKDHHIKLEKELKKELKDHYRHGIEKNGRLANYRCLDVVFRIAGTGSIGIKRYCFLLEHIKKIGKYLLLDMKEARPSSLSPYLNFQQPAWQNEAERICTVQEYMQNVVPDLLHPTLFQNDHYVIRELQPSEDKINFKEIKELFRDIEQVIMDMATLTGSAQLRSAGRKGSAIADDLIAFGNETKWQQQILDLGKEYFYKTKKHFNIYSQLYKEGYFN